MSAPSLRLRLLTFLMERIVKPRLRRAGTPQEANLRFERSARFVFSTPKGMLCEDVGPCLKITCGAPCPGRAVLYLHGGAFVTGSRHSYRAFAGRFAKRTRSAVFLADYPVLQEAAFPAAPDAALAAWDHMIAAGWAPHQIMLAGDSAGGNLVFGLLATLLARAERPAGVVAFSPWADLTLSGETLDTNATRDPLIPVSRMRETVDLYLCGADARDPRASPVFAKFPDPPPVLIQVGESEVLRSDSQRLAQASGARLDVWPHVPHVWQLFDGRLPEAGMAMRDVALFAQTSFESAKR